MCHQWFRGGARAIRTFPMICTQRCRVEIVGSQSRQGSSGHGSSSWLGDVMVWIPTSPASSPGSGRRSLLGLEPERLIHEDNGDATRIDLAIDDQDLVHAAVNAVCLLGTGVLERKRVLLDAAQAFLEISHDLLGPGHEDDVSGARDIRTELTTAHRGGYQRPGLRDRVDAAQHVVGGGAQPTDLVGLRLAVHAPDERTKRLIAAGLLEDLGDPGCLERLRGSVVDLGSFWDEAEHDALRIDRVGCTENTAAVGFERSRRAMHAIFVRQGCETAAERPFDWGFGGCDQFSASSQAPLPIYLRLQVDYA